MKAAVSHRKPTTDGRPFIKGVASILFGANRMPMPEPTGKNRDKEAIMNYWKAVGNYLRSPFANHRT